MTAPSPGNWHCGPLIAASCAEPDDPPVCLIRNDAGDILAEVWKPMNPATDQTTLANGKLMAEAPALVEALKECLTSDNAQCIVTNDVAYMMRRFKAINKIANAAISKATQ